MFGIGTAELTEEEKQKVRDYVDQKWSAEMSQDRLDYKYNKYCVMYAEWKDIRLQTTGDAIHFDDPYDWIEVREKLPTMDIQLNYLLLEIKELQDRIAYLEKMINN